MASCVTADAFLAAVAELAQDGQVPQVQIVRLPTETGSTRYVLLVFVDDEWQVYGTYTEAEAAELLAAAERILETEKKAFAVLAANVPAGSPCPGGTQPLATIGKKAKKAEPPVEEPAALAVPAGTTLVDPAWERYPKMKPAARAVLLEQMHRRLNRGYRFQREKLPPRLVEAVRAAARRVVPLLTARP